VWSHAISPSRAHEGSSAAATLACRALSAHVHLPWPYGTNNISIVQPRSLTLPNRGVRMRRSVAFQITDLRPVP
jgi:hypothetical protein